MPSALILLAEGTEESEFTITYDVLVRGGVKVSSVLVPCGENDGSKGYVTCSRGVKILADLKLEDVVQHSDRYSSLILPGGLKGANTFSKDEKVLGLVRDMYGKGKVVAFICAGSLAAKAAGIGKGKSITSHPSVKEKLEEEYDYKEERVVVDGNLITSRGPGTTFGFALALVEALQGKEERDKIEGPMVLPEKL
ncbi:DJ-1 [Violaceomyces palustris]|uniref:DJ-1 n=1 Tax=Violaceomyces palustris TaxID=1673888 RepID=A0ACD0NZ66_9BASI|nr:DJ-1 [Violaceomyces palustris]